ncbi:MAG: hypothetical protein JEZ03_12360 [Bacteroidales bacterium]|nr:hypothetical protein [Bacteroidales bacterium]
MKKNLLFLCIILIGSAISFAQSIKGPESISYFQAPAEGIKFKSADVFMNYDQALADAKREAQKEKNSAMGSKFGALGEGIANTANSALDAMAETQKAIDALKDKNGRFDKWNFIPEYIIADAGTKNSVIVEIFIMNDQDPSPGSMMNTPIQADKDGYYDVPFYINCRYKVTTAKGLIIAEKNFGILQGKKKTKYYTAPPQAAGLGTVTQTEGLTSSEKVGINVAYNKVRQDVFGMFGFGQFNAPIKLGVIKEIKESKKLIKPMLAIFENKTSLLLSESEKAEVQNFVDIIEQGKANCSDKSRWVAYHNLAVCYSWLEQPLKAKEAYTKYGEEIKETLDKMRKWDLLVQGKLSKEERKGFGWIGMKDQKKYRNYQDIEPFVKYYAAGATRYKNLFTTINRDLKRFVDFYAVNDLLCQLFEIDYPYQFFPLNDFKGMPKSCKGQLTKEGSEPIDYKVKFDRNRQIKELEAEQIAENADGSKEKVITRELQPIFNENNGRYICLSTANDRNVFTGGHGLNKGSLKEIEEPLGEMTFGKASNITKKAGFWGDKESSEGVQLKVDLEGNLYFAGTADYFKANSIFKEILTSNGIEIKRTDSKAEFMTKADINENGVFDRWSWDGSVQTWFGSWATQNFSVKAQNIKADKMLRDIVVVERDERGNPKKIEYTFSMKGRVKVTQKLDFNQWMNAYVATYDPKAKANTSTDKFDMSSKMIWDCEFIYDDQGNWTQMKMGPYSATRTFKY